MKSKEKKKDFIERISSMTDKELNDYIKRHGNGPKPVVMCTIISNEDKTNGL